jgi:hypothetical protein
MRIKIDENVAVIVWETLNPKPSEPTDRYSYYVEYKDTADKPRESEICNGFISPDHCVQDALANLDCLDLRPEPEPEPREPPITVPYHYHICCKNHRCVNPACEVQEEFYRRRVADVICPDCGEKTGQPDPLGYMKIEKLMPLVIERANAA